MQISQRVAAATVVCCLVVRLVAFDLLARRQARPDVPPPGIVVLTTIDYGYRHIGANFLCNIRRLALAERLVVSVLDKQTERFLRDHFPEFHLISSYGPQDALGTSDDRLAVFGTPEFEKVTRSKTDAILNVMQLNPHVGLVLFSDADVVWCRSPFDVMREVVANAQTVDRTHDTIAVPVITDITRNPDVYFSPDPPLAYLNSGFYFLRNTEQVRRVLVKNRHTSGRNDQVVYHKILCDGRGAKRTVSGCRGSHGLVTYLLDRDVFSNGKAMMNGKELLDYPAADIQRECSATSARRTLHFNYLKGYEKERKMKQAGFWLLNQTALDLATPGSSLCLRP